MYVFVFEVTLPIENTTKCLLSFSGNFKCIDPMKLQPKVCQRAAKCPLKYFANLSATPSIGTYENSSKACPTTKALFSSMGHLK